MLQKLEAFLNNNPYYIVEDNFIIGRNSVFSDSLIRGMLIDDVYYPYRWTDSVDTEIAKILEVKMGDPKDYPALIKEIFEEKVKDLKEKLKK